MITGKCKGARDFLPGEMSKFKVVGRQFRRACSARGFEEIRTPLIEYFHLFTSAGTLTPKMLGRVYSFLDWDGWSGERVVLRPEGTIPAARLYLENLPRGSLARLFYLENMFSFEEDASQPREKWQGGVELIGSSAISADVELLTLALEILESLNVGPVEMKVSHAGYLRAMLSSLGLSPQKEEKLYEAIVDGQDMEEAVGSTFRDIEDKDGLDNLVLLREKTLKSLENLKALTKLSPEMNEKIKNFVEICRLIEDLGYRFKMDFAGGKGLEYYTGFYYRLYVRNIEIGGGGRYDGLVNDGSGVSIPASGFALYLDRIISLLPDTTSGASSNRVYIVAETVNESALLAGMKTARALREKGFRTEMALTGGQENNNRWVLECSPRNDVFNLKDRQTKKDWKLTSLPELLRTLGEPCK